MIHRAIWFFLGTYELYFWEGDKNGSLCVWACRRLTSPHIHPFSKRGILIGCACVHAADLGLCWPHRDLYTFFLTEQLKYFENTSREFCWQVSQAIVICQKWRKVVTVLHLNTHSEKLMRLEMYHCTTKHSFRRLRQSKYNEIYIKWTSFCSCLGKLTFYSAKREKGWPSFCLDWWSVFFFFFNIKGVGLIRL